MKHRRPGFIQNSFACSVLFILFNIAQFSYCLPEIGRWNKNLVKNDTLVFHRSMLNGSEVQLRIYCQKHTAFSISWVLLQSPCFEMFFDLDATALVNSIDDISFKSSDISFVKGSKSVQCSPDIPVSIESTSPISRSKSALSNDVKDEDKRAVAPGALAKVWESGAHVLVLKIDCGHKPCSFSITLQLEMRNPNGGFLSALESPFLPFNATMSLFYLVATIVWLVFLVRYWNELMRIQIFIGLLLMLGLWEHLTFFAVFETIRKTGQFETSAVYFAELLTCAKRTLIRVLVLVACLGYSITKPRLSTIWFRRCLIIGLVFFLLLLLEAMGRVAKPRLVTTPFRLITVAMLSVMDTGVMWWTFTHLARTLRETRMRHSLVKHALYRRFSYVLVFAFFVSLSFLIASFELFKHYPCIRNWRYLWIDDAFWHFMFFLLLLVIIVLWRPTGANREYAYSLLDNPLETADEEEEVLLDRIGGEGGIMTEIRVRQMDDENGHSNEDTVKQQANSDPTKGPIPASIVERMGIEATSGPDTQQPVWKVE